jgi:hypothetical protein
MAFRDKHEIKREHMDDLAEAAMGEGLKAVKAFLAYQGNDQRYAQKFKAGATLIGAYSRFYASQTNRLGLEMQAERDNSKALAPPVVDKPKVMTAGRKAS